MFWFLYKIARASTGPVTITGDGSAIGDAVASGNGASIAASAGAAQGDAICAGVIQDATPVVVVTPTVTAAATGVGGRAWRSWYKSTLPKKKRKLVDELDEMIAALEERIVPVEVAGFDEETYQRTLRVSQDLATRQDIGEVTNERIANQIDQLKRAIEEIDDEEAIILALS